MKERAFFLDVQKTAVLRKTRGLQANLARLWKIQNQYVQAYLTGKKAIPESRLNELCVIAQIQKSEVLTSEDLVALINL